MSPRRSATYEHWFFARAQAALPTRPDSMGAATATWQHGGSVGWSNVSPGSDAEWQTLRGSSDTNCSPKFATPADRDHRGAPHIGQPYAGFIYFHLLLDRLTEAGHLSSEPPSDM
jgi:hypothetical protein